MVFIHKHTFTLLNCHSHYSQVRSESESHSWSYDSDHRERCGPYSHTVTTTSLYDMYSRLSCTVIHTFHEYAKTKTKTRGNRCRLRVHPYQRRASSQSLVKCLNSPNFALVLKYINKDVIQFNYLPFSTPSLASIKVGTRSELKRPLVI